MPRMFDFGLAIDISEKLSGLLPADDPLQETRFFMELAQGLEGSHSVDEFLNTYDAICETLPDALRLNMPAKLERQCLLALCADYQFRQDYYIACGAWEKFDTDSTFRAVFLDGLTGPVALITVACFVFAFAGAIARLIGGETALGTVYTLATLFVYGLGSFLFVRIFLLFFLWFFQEIMGAVSLLIDGIGSSDDTKRVARIRKRLERAKVRRERYRSRIAQGRATWRDRLAMLWFSSE